MTRFFTRIAALNIPHRLQTIPIYRPSTATKYIPDSDIPNIPPAYINHDLQQILELEYQIHRAVMSKIYAYKEYENKLLDALQMARWLEYINSYYFNITYERDKLIRDQQHHTGALICKYGYQLPLDNPRHEHKLIRANDISITSLKPILKGIPAYVLFGSQIYYIDKNLKKNSSASAQRSLCTAHCNISR